jgi:hypothetical protein
MLLSVVLTAGVLSCTERQSELPEAQLTVSLVSRPDLGPTMFEMRIRNDGDQFTGVSKPFFRDTRLLITSPDGETLEVFEDAVGIDLGVKLDPGEEVVWVFDVTSFFVFEFAGNYRLAVSVNGFRTDEKMIT